MAAVSFNIDTREFNLALNAYLRVSKTEPAKIVVRKAWFIARAATRLTPKADYKKIRSELSSQDTFYKAATFNNARNNRKFKTAPLAALIINRRRGKKGEPGLYGASMKRAIKEMINARVRSVAFLKAGWLYSLRGLGTLGTALGMRGMMPRYQDKQLATFKNLSKIGGLVVQGIKTPHAAVTIINSANAKNDHKNALLKYAGPALRAAFANEAASTRAEIEKRYRENARRVGIRTN